jgi:hypothetical protein
LLSLVNPTTTSNILQNQQPFIDNFNKRARMSFSPPPNTPPLPSSSSGGGGILITKEAKEEPEQFNNNEEMMKQIQEDTQNQSIFFNKIRILSKSEF